jgi:hypothetical protein
MSDNRQNPELLVIPSRSITHRRPRLGGLLMRLGAWGAVGLPAIETLLLVLLPAKEGLVFKLFGLVSLVIVMGTFVAPLIAIAGAILTAISFPFSFSGELRADDTGLIIVRGKRETRLGKDRFEGGIVFPSVIASGKPPKVALNLKGGNVIYADLADGMAGHRLLDRLGIDPAKRRVAVALTSPLRQLGAGCLSVPLSIVVFAIPLGMLLAYTKAPDWPIVVYCFCILFTMIVVMRIARPTEVIIGNDGLRIRTWSRDQWIPYARIRSVEERAKALFVEVVLTDPLTQRIQIASGSADMMLALAGRIRIAMALGSNGEADSALGERLEPQGKPLEQWKSELRSLVSTAGYRRTNLSSEVLLSVIDDPDMPPGQRLGAAVALRFAEHPEASERIRFAAEACADENVKRAFEQVSTGELSEQQLRRAIE